MRSLYPTNAAEGIIGARVCAALGLLFGLAACAAPQTATMHTLETPPPPALRDPPPEPIRSLFPGYVLVETQDLDQGEISLFLDEQTRASNPWALSWVRADFDGNGVGDHAVLLRTPDGILPVYQTFAVLMGTHDGRYEVAHDSPSRGFADYLIIRELEAGTTVREFQSVDGPDLQIELRNPAVEILYLGKAAVAYYWDPSWGRIETIATAD